MTEGGLGPYIGDYEGLTALGTGFYGTFSASNAPDPSHFPRGVYYQRYVLRGGQLLSNFNLTAQGDLSTGITTLGLLASVAPISIDPFFFSVTDLYAQN